IKSDHDLPFSRYIWAVRYMDSFSNYNDKDTIMCARLLDFFCAILLNNARKPRDEAIEPEVLVKLDDFVANLGVINHYALRTRIVQLVDNTGRELTSFKCPTTEQELAD